MRYSEPATYDICVLPVTGGGSTCLTPPDENNDQGPDWSPNGREIVWQRERNGEIDLWIMNADGSSPRLLLDHSFSDTSPQWSPDGRSILFRSFRYGPPCQFILDVASGLSTPVLGDSLDPAFMESAGWTPDGKGVIIEVVAGNNRLAFVDLTTRDAHFISNDTTSYFGWPSMVRY